MKERVGWTHDMLKNNYIHRILFGAEPNNRFNSNLFNRILRKARDWRQSTKVYDRLYSFLLLKIWQIKETEMQYNTWIVNYVY